MPVLLVFRKLSPMLMSTKLFPTFSSFRFSVSDLCCDLWFTWTWILCRAIDMGLFACLYMLTYNYSTICWRCLFYSIAYFWLLCQKSGVPRCVGLHLICVFSSIALINLSVFMPIICGFLLVKLYQLEIRDGDIWGSSFIV